MDRLTINLNNGHAGVKGYTPDWKVVDRLAAYEDTGLEPGELVEMQNEAYDLGYQSCLRYKGLTWSEAEELQRYRKAEAEGRLTMLPVKEGETVYYIIESKDDAIKTATVEGIYFSQRGFTFVCNTHLRFFTLRQHEVYPTREEAEAALKGGTDG